MRRSTHATPLLSCAVWLVTMLVAQTAHAQDDAFRAGLEARTGRKWQETAAQMRRAIQSNPQESSRKVRSGIGGLLRQGGTEYLPHYFLGEALFNLDDCAGAVDAWSKSEQQGAIRTRPEFVAVLQKGYVACEAKGVLPPAKYDALLVRARQQVSDVTALASTISNLGQANLELFHANMREQYERGANEIENAQSRLATATRTRTQRDFADVAAAAERARGILTTLEANLNAAVAARVAAVTQAKEVLEIIGAAEAQDRAIDGRKIWLTQVLAAERQYGRDALKNARDRIAGTPSASAVTEARTLANDGSMRLRKVFAELTKIERSAVDRRLAESLAPAREALSFVGGAMATLDRLTAEKPAMVRPEMTAEREAIERQVVNARRRLESAEKAQNIAAIVEATKLASDAQDRLDALIKAFGPVTIIDRGVHPALEQGARLFFAGEYQQALSALSPAGGLAPDIPLQVHVHLFRAAALYNLFVRSRESDRSLLTRAQAEVEQCRKLQPAFQPDPRAFAPRFIDFFQKGSTQATQPGR